jgi:heme-degrading monooxygenase HmoA/catechol 2,3-dioxygenase-like lactoylglutathione lyase family enzyme
MLHHVDVHVRRLEPVRTLFDALSETIGYRCRVREDDFVGYETSAGGRPRIGFILDEQAGGTMRLAFSVESRQLVDQAGEILRANGALAIEGPSLNPEYGDDYYAVFFEDSDGNKYEILVDPVAAPAPKVARIWRGRVRPGMVRAYRGYVAATGIPGYRSTAGNLGAWILTASGEDHDDVVTLSFWNSREAIAGFAGKPIERAHYYPEDEKYLLDFPKEVEHFDMD